MAMHPASTSSSTSPANAPAAFAEGSLRALAMPGVAGLRPYRPGRNAEEIAATYGLSEVVKLASNENPLGPGAKARAALADLGDLARYPDGNGTLLRRALARHHAVAPEQITLGNGSNDVLELIARALAGPGREVIYARHAFAVYALATRAVSAEAVEVPTVGLDYDPEAMAAAVTEHTRLLFLANPNNPTGAWVGAAALRRLLQALPAHVVVVVDEAYTEYMEEADYPQCIPWIAEYPQLVVTRTFSKIHGLAGLRVGYAVSHPELADLMNRVRQPFNVNVPAMRAAIAALDDAEHVERSLECNRRGLAQLREGLTALGLTRMVSSGNFICIDFGRPALPIFEQLLRRGVIVRPIDNYGLPEHLRVTIGTEPENRRCLQALAELLR